MVLNHITQSTAFIIIAAALTHPDRHLVSNGLGVASLSIHLGPTLPFHAGDTVLIATDGVTDNAREGEMIECLRSGPLHVGASHLVDLCRDRMGHAPASRPRTARVGKPDDLTLLVIRRRGGEWAGATMAELGRGQGSA